MAEKSSDELHWRETYFILFPQDRRPELQQVSQALQRANARFHLANPAADPHGYFESLLVESLEDHAAVEISYEVGEAIIEQNLEWAKQLQEELPVKQLQKLIKADARLDVAHFERVPPEGEAAITEFLFADEFGTDEEMAFEMLDPTCLLTVVDTLAELTKGLTFDPASGEILS